VPELPDLTIYVEALERRLVGERLERARLASPFVLRTVEPPLAELEGRAVESVRRLGKRLVLAFEGARFLCLHLMVAGRLRWRATPASAARGRAELARFEFRPGTLLLSEASKKKRAALHVVAGEESLALLDPGGVEPLATPESELRAALARENRTLKRALTDPRLIAGVGNAFSDEILWAARLSPFARTSQLDDAEWRRLVEAIRATLSAWIGRLRAETGDRFPERVTAFKEGLAVHGRFGRPCPRCGGAVQRLVYAENEANYCPACQTGGRLLADRALSRLLHGDWPRSLEELEERKAGATAPGARGPGRRSRGG
jgi:formamidopyrimidine-DNA glycosylase